MSDISELFARDPLKLTNEQVDEIIEEMRRKRHLFESATPAAKKPASPKQAAAASLASKLDFKL